MLLLLEISIKVLASRSVCDRTKPLYFTREDDKAFALQSVTSSGLSVWIVQLMDNYEYVLFVTLFSISGCAVDG